MKFARFLHKGQVLWGVVGIDSELTILDGCPICGYKLTAEKVSLADVSLLAPAEPGKIVGVGLNYKAAAIAKGQEFPAEPVIFFKPSSSLIGPDANIEIPDIVKTPAFEVELAVVIGKTAKNVSESDALNYVCGYTLANDVTAKDQMIKGQPWARGKGFDTFTPLGPYLVTDLKPDDVGLIARVNGEEKQNSSTKDMIFGVRQLIAFISRLMSLQPGDVIITGTPLGGGEFTRGDSIELSSPAIGTMRNSVV